MASAYRLQMKFPEAIPTADITGQLPNHESFLYNITRFFPISKLIWKVCCKPNMTYM